MWSEGGTTVRKIMLWGLVYGYVGVVRGGARVRTMAQSWYTRYVMLQLALIAHQIAKIRKKLVQLSGLLKHSFSVELFKKQ